MSNWLSSCAAALVVLVTSTAAASSLVPPKPAPAAAKYRAEVDAIVVDARIHDHAALEDALRVRITDRSVSHSGRARAPGKGEVFGYLEIERATAQRASVRLLLSDGRAYVRVIEAPASARAREIAATIANLLVGIEDGAIAPTQEHVPLPPALRPVAPPPDKPAPPRVRVAARPEWGVLVGGVNVIPLGPPAPRGYGAGGGEVRGEFRWVRGVSLGVALRIAGLGHAPYGLLRVRIAPGVGWSLRRGRFELNILGAITVEPWLLLRDARVPRPADRRPASAVLGSAVRIEPTGRIALKRGRSLRLGVYVEAAGSAIPSRSGGVARVRARNDDGTLSDLFRVGGFELTAGLLIGAWIPKR